MRGVCVMIGDGGDLFDAYRTKVVWICRSCLVNRCIDAIVVMSHARQFERSTWKCIYYAYVIWACNLKAVVQHHQQVRLIPNHLLPTEKTIHLSFARYTLSLHPISSQLASQHHILTCPDVSFRPSSLPDGSSLLDRPSHRSSENSHSKRAHPSPKPY